MELDLIGKNSWYQIVAINFTLFLKPFGPKRQKKNALYLSVNVFSTKVLIGDTILRLLMETGPPFYVVIRATRRSSRLQGKGSTFISQLFLRP